MILGKLAPPRAPDGFVTRPRLVDRLDRGASVVTVVAPPGYGKTEAARQWATTKALPTAWLTVDLLDERPDDFWCDLLAALRVVLPGLSPGLDHLLGDGSADRRFVGELIGEVERIGSPAAIVLDGVERAMDRVVQAHLALMADHVGHLLRMVFVSRSDLALPTARWRSSGSLTEVREADLRMTDQEAVALAATYPELRLGETAAVALNERAEGWAAGLQLSLLALIDAEDTEAAALRTAGSDRLLADYLVAEVLDSLPEPEREVALALSVLTVFDADLCAALLGPAAVPVARSLGRRRLFVTVIDDRTGAMRFHPMFRQLLEHELRWRDPEALADLHRRAAAITDRRGDLDEAPPRRTVHPHAVGAAEPDLQVADHGPVGRALGRPPPVPGAMASGPTGAAAAIEPGHRGSATALTPREASLLALLPTHLSYAQMGERLYLSVNTVKGNLKVLYRKLDANSRADAVEVAKIRGLIPPTSV